jgi:acetyl esterase/lipase
MTITPQRLRTLLGIETREPRVLASEVDDRGTCLVERLQLEIGGAGPVRGLLTRPPHSARPLPAILYGHSHGGRYDIGAAELIDGREYLEEPLGAVFARAGYVTLAIDMPVFGERATESESAAAKRLLWRGKSLFGEMLSDHAAALSYLAGREDVDGARIGAFGMSMGCTLSYWLAAVDPRIAAVAHHCCFCDFATLVELGNHDRHGIYLTVPGLLHETSTGEIAGLVAPRPQFIAIGEADPLTPPLAVERGMAAVSAAYAAADASGGLNIVREPGIEHQETPRMRNAMLDFFRNHLRP